MANDTVVRARIDSKTKAAAEAVLEKMGLDTSTAFRMMMRRIAQDKRLPFEPLVPNAKTRAAIAEARAGKVKRFASVDELMADLDADD